MVSHTFNRRALMGAMAIAPVVIAAPVAAAATPSKIETLRLEHRAVTKAGNAKVYDDDDPVFVRIMDRLGEIESEILKTDAAHAADAKAKLRFAMDLSDDGVWLDGDDANLLIADVARFLL